MVGQALAVVDNAFKNEKYASNGKKRFGSNYPLPLFQKPIRRNQKVRDLFFKSGLVDASEQLIGEGHVTLRENMPDVSFNAQSELAAEEGMGLTEPFPSRKWQMQSGQGFYKGSGGDCNFMVGVALSDGQDVDENRGQFTVWPGSHVIIHPVLSQLVREDPPPDHLLKALRAKKIDVGSPKRILLKPGDAFIAHQRLASTQGINLLKKVRKSVYFKIAHTDYDEMQDEFLESKLPFTGFEPLQDIVADEFGG
ncbi:unnamed protein product [Chondrus crispus]|uniref:Uncharacterized protein n=1 Tax=Chondrus crispus TaxID=2769 RepID=R7QKB4_CHOCR|nr:unnamed protein product [Chondrus crispus]CDF38213.1 unnamed protein product [Chondrus crispus]|eukprot:XP_005718098.1 unnamed protein product [Chondrus crispus]